MHTTNTTSSTAKYSYGWSDNSTKTSHYSSNPIQYFSSAKQNNSGKDYGFRLEDEKKLSHNRVNYSAGKPILEEYNAHIAPLEELCNQFAQMNRSLLGSTKYCRVAYNQATKSYEGSYENPVKSSNYSTYSKSGKSSGGYSSSNSYSSSGNK